MVESSKGENIYSTKFYMKNNIETTLDCYHSYLAKYITFRFIKNRKITTIASAISVITFDVHFYLFYYFYLVNPYRNKQHGNSLIHL